jgi:protein-arginine kinase activator protein McsA
MYTCENCGKDTDELYPHEARLPETPEDAKILENPEEIIKNKSKIRFKNIHLMVCRECLKQHEADLNDLLSKMIHHQAEVSREWFEDRGESEKLK